MDTCHVLCAVGCLVTYSSPAVQKDNTGHPRRQGIVQASVQALDALRRCLATESCDLLGLSDWLLVASYPAAWAHFMQQCFFAVHAAVKQEAAETMDLKGSDQCDVTWISARDKIVDEIVKTSR